MKTLRKLAALVLAGALCMSTLAGCGINPDETAATLGEENVSLGLVNFMCKYQKATADDYYTALGAYYGVDMWDTDLYGTGSTMKDTLVSSVVSALHDLYTLKAHMSDYDVVVTEEQEKAIKEAAAAFMSSNSKEAIEEFGATEELVIEMLTLYTIQMNMYEAIIVDTDREVSDEDANMRGYSYIEISLEGKTVDGKYTEYTDDEITALKEEVNKMAEKIANGSTLEEIAKEYDYEVETGAYSTKEDDSSIDEELLDEMKDLKEGETSALIEGTDEVLYFARIDADTDKDATADKRDEIIAERESELYDSVMTEWQKEDGWTVNEDVIAKIDFHHVFTQYDSSAESESESESGTGTETESESTTETGTEK